MNYEDETLKQPPSSNFIAHAVVCQALPDSESFESWCMSSTTLQHQASTTTMSKGIGAQREFMQKFNEQGCENPAREVTQKGF